MARSFFTLLAAAVLCGGTALADGISVQPGGAQAAEPAGQWLQRLFAGFGGAAPFERGAITVIAAEPQGMGTWTLVPCAGGAAICGGSERGPRGSAGAADDHLVVTGLYGRTFRLAPGGGGTLQYRSGVTVPLAWD